ncbi:hypothetical protein KR767_05970 [Luteibacter anthropi]|uniref:hypothetical protein n=1 Tax=Luteibacter anthropi TaxID=564369 RepID=UPI0020328EAA|nr:hypothetical protein [Luteibacter anthropi]URX63600.1 hypothetical protein KR767_05970 [Luteibacter anthropi]
MNVKPRSMPSWYANGPECIDRPVKAGQLAAALLPTMYLFYRHRVMDIADTLPKYLDGWDGPTI